MTASRIVTAIMAGALFMRTIGTLMQWRRISSDPKISKYISTKAYINMWVDMAIDVTTAVILLR